MRILHLITRLELGGAQQNTLFTCRSLAERGHDVLLATGAGGLLDDEARRTLPRVTFLKHLVRSIHPVHDTLAVTEIRALVRRERPDIVHTHSSKAGALGRIGARLAGARAVVHTIHGWSFAPGMPAATQAIYRMVERACAPLTDHFISVSRKDLETGFELGIVPRDRGVVIRSGIDLRGFSHEGPGRDEVRREWGVAESDVLVVSVANLKPQKAPLDFVAACAISAAEEPSLKFAFVGDGEQREEVERAVAAAGLSARLVLPGWRRDVDRVMRAADVVALSSLWEGLPRSVVQARATGRPVVATAVNGTPEAVIEGVTGFLVPPRDTAAMARRFVELARDAALRQRMGRAAREGLDEFDEVTMVDAQERLYAELLDGSRGHRTRR